MTAEQAIDQSRATGQPVRIQYSRDAHMTLVARADDFDEHPNGVEVYLGDGWTVEVEAPFPLR